MATTVIEPGPHHELMKDAWFDGIDWVLCCSAQLGILRHTVHKQHSAKEGIAKRQSHCTTNSASLPGLGHEKEQMRTLLWFVIQQGDSI